MRRTCAANVNAARSPACARCRGRLNLRRLCGRHFKRVTGYIGSRLDGKTAQLIALNLPLELAMSNQLTFAGDDAGLERALFKGSARVAPA